MTKTVGFSDLQTSKASDDTASDFEEGACNLPKDSDWTAVLVDECDILFFSENRTDVNNTKQ